MISDINDPSLKKAEDPSKETSKGAQVGQSSVGSTPVSSVSFYSQNGTGSSAVNVQSNSNTQPGANEQVNINMQDRLNVHSNTNIPPPLPERNQTSGAGSSNTIYAPPGSTFVDSSTYREPELVPDDENMPALMPAHDTGARGMSGWPSGSGGGWNTAFDTPWDQPNFNTQLGSASWDEREPPIDGRSSYEEQRWWDPEVKSARPGYGMLAPLLADMLHNPEHTLVSVSVTPPDILPTAASSTSTSAAASPKLGSLSPPSSPSPAKSTHSRSSSTSQFSPSAEEVREAIPHPHAYYCRKHNGWVLLAWRSSSVLPAVVGEHGIFPDPQRRKAMHSCLDETPFDKPNKTHHFHYYPKAVNARDISPGYVARSFEKAERAKQARRRMTVGSDDLSSETLERALANELESQKETEAVTEAKEEEQAVNLLDLYLCCQCSLYVVCSDVIPGVIPVKYVEDFIAEKSVNPFVGKTAEQAVHQAWETTLTYVCVVLF